MKKELPKTLNVWDIDDTLFKSDARVVIMKDGKVHKTLDPGTFNTYDLGPGEKFDFSQFRSGKVFRETARPIASVLDRAKEIVARQGDDSHSIILTARSDFPDKEEFLQTFRDHGFPIDKVYVERAGNLSKLKHDSKPHINKGVILKKYMAKGQWDRIRMWDDSKQNLDMLLKVAKSYPDLEVIAYLVDHSGKVSRYGEQKKTLKESIKSLIRHAVKEKDYK